MKEKIKKLMNWLFKRWVRIAEIVVVIWAINGMLGAISITEEQFLLEVRKNILWQMEGLNPPFLIVLSYFLSAVLILYLLRKFQK